MTEHVVIRVTGKTAGEAAAAARDWAHAEPKMRLRTICSVRRMAGPDGELTDAWRVELAVEFLT